MFEGSLVALVTPMNADGSVDWPGLVRLVHWHVEQGTSGLVPAGTTGESPTLSREEHQRVLTTVIDAVAGAVPVIAGCGSYSTRDALEMHQFARNAGANAALHVTGYYNRPSAEGVYRHFEQIAELNDLPVIVYNVPHRTVIDIEPATLARIAGLPNVVGVKDATRDLARPMLERMLIDKPFAFLTGEDATAVAYNISGGVGCISVTANVVPGACAAMQQACQLGDFKKASRIQLALMPLHQALFADPSPAGAKYACSKLGLCSDTVRLPMVAALPQARALIDSALQSAESALELAAS